MDSLDLYYNHCVVELLGHELHININSNVLRTMLVLFVYWSFLSFIVSFQHKKSSKYIKLFWMMSHNRLHYNHGVLESLWQE
jgi:hypothetical protein